MMACYQPFGSKGQQFLGPCTPMLSARLVSDWLSKVLCYNCLALIANKILTALSSLTSFITIPVMVLTQSALGCLAALTLGVILLPFSLIWDIFFVGPLMGLAWAWERVEHIPGPPLIVDLIGVPLALLTCPRKLVQS